MTAIPAIGEALRHHECVGEAATSILKKTCSLTLAPLDEGTVTNTEVVIAIISLVGHVEWSVFIGLPKPTACGVAAKFAGFEIPFESADMGDAVGELANIVAGDVKARLDGKGVKADVSLPTVIRAQDIHVLIQRNAFTVKTCYGSELGPLWIGVTAGRNGGFVT
jgi:chemotaxis protein CheX